MVNKPEDEFTRGQIAIIAQMIGDQITKFRESALLGSQGICMMQHKNIRGDIKDCLREELTEWKDTITRRIIYATIAIVIGQVALKMIWG